MKKYITVLLLILTFLNVTAQEDKTNESGVWLTLANKFKITDKLFVSNILQWRTVEGVESTRVFIEEPSVHYKFNDKITFGLGYDYTNYNLVGIRPPSVDYENRFQQMLSLFSTFGKVNMNQRFMFEERFFVKTNGQKAYGNRFRYRINLDFNIVKFNNDKYLLGRVSDEIRIRFTEGINDPTFGQNNFVAALGYKLLDNSKIYMGYGRNYYNAGVLGYWGDNIFYVLYSYDFDFTKKQFYK
jgi:hypothetical protein